jgi:competence protein ComEA
MRIPYFSSLIFALLAGASVAVTAAPAATPAEPIPATAPASPVEQITRVNINVASAEVLQKELSGIGAAKAQAIVAYRDEHGGFTSVDEMIEVKGVGKALLEKNREKLSID